MGTPFRRFLLSSLGALAIASLGLAQTTGSIIGTVTDTDGKPLPGVTVEGTSPNLQGSRTAVTSGDGLYRLASLPPGVYKVTGTLTGLGKVEKSTTVALDATSTVNLQLSLTTQASVTVTGETPLVDTTSTTGGTNYTSKVMEKLPLGAITRRSSARTRASTPDQGDTQGRAVSLTIYGATSVENQYIIDGVNTTNVISGFQGKAINSEFIQEVEVKTGGYQAEYGRAMGGVVNVITKSGGNEFHGDGFGYFDNYDMRATQVINDEDIVSGVRISDYNRTDFGVDLGGPIIKDKLWFFGAYNRVNRPAKVSNYQDQLNVPASAQFPADSTDNLYSGKLTWNIGTGTTFVGTVFADPSKVTGAASSDPTHSRYPTSIVSFDPSTWQSTLDVGGPDYGFRVNQLFGSSGLLSAQYSHHADRYQMTPLDATGIRQDNWTCTGGTPDNPCTIPSNANSSTGGFGAVMGYLANNDSTRNQIRADISLSFGNHEVKVGGDYQQGKTTAIRFFSGLQAVHTTTSTGRPITPTTSAPRGSTT